ncbi:unnamed protein product [Symbiodinium sp. CCMP2592]|nr:unnamed protein product [Symbiodinium sp. CCMP2592]CAE7586784.1 unnamed protein product [Symbiodinium sp. CCMP2592]CAE7638807.1 unnamed protein product [Symbiodinium sp. CCMP2592]
MIQPLTVFQWVSVALLSCHPAGCNEAELFETAPARRAHWLEAFHRILNGYNERVSVDGVEKQPTNVKKRKRASRQTKQSAEAAAELDQSSIKIGTQRQTAIKCVLQHFTRPAWETCTHHMAWTYSAANSAFSDALLSWTHLYPGSQPPQSCLPTEVQVLAAHEARHLNRLLSGFCEPL